MFTSVLPTKSFSLKDLSNYDGREGTPHYFVSDGHVWDASSSDMFKSAYGQWSGRDASFALAKMSLSDEDINRTDYDSLSEEDMESLQSWTQYFNQKYLIKGHLTEYKERRRG
jgi:predicted heme/steroid binding protein